MSNVSSKMHRHIPERWDVDEAWYFVTVVTRERRPYFKSGKTCEILLQSCRSVKKHHPFRLGGLAILPDHFHAIIKPYGNEVIESVVGSLKRDVFHVSWKQLGEPIRWQARFMDHRIRDEADYFRHLEYMRINPCKHELVGNEDEAWPWWFVHDNPFGQSR